MEIETFDTDFIKIGSARLEVHKRLVPMSDGIGFYANVTICNNIGDEMSVSARTFNQTYNIRENRDKAAAWLKSQEVDIWGTE
jgi:hypothetical protein